MLCGSRTCPKYNLARLTFVTVASFLLGAILWKKGKKSTECSVVYRERFAGMYSSWTCSLAQVIVEIPYPSIFYYHDNHVYPTIGFYWSVEKVLWISDSGTTNAKVVGFGVTGIAHHRGP
ncbi:hypothetical protein POM88_008557 [Heracleum sosnowskyi]|uniref:Uncharacterized protein n=1 Tax=Heracleum sosnowskyi TaxID=360622 RepID=A0AAD8J6W7_9APIA|nr:hypothetical protein POM88_008557 [Heracleum sosnowskyi]